MDKYFNNLDLSKADITKVDSLIGSTIDSLYSSVQNSTIHLFDKTYEKKEDYKELVDEILNSAFGEAEKVNKCKVMFAIYISGLSIKDSNMFGLIKLLLTAVRSCGSLLDVDVYNVYKRYNNELKEHKLEPITVGSISKCNFLGKKIDFDANDTFAGASDNRYNARILANVRDYDKKANKEYAIKVNAHRAIEQSVLKDYKQSDAFRKTVTNRLNREVMSGRNPSKESVENLLLNSATVKAYLEKQTADAYNKWLETSYKPMIDKYNNRSELLKNKRFSLEDFD